MRARTTLVGKIDDEVLTFTVGKDPVLDLALVEADCLGTAAHVAMLARVPVRPALLSRAEAGRLTQALAGIVRRVRAGRFGIRRSDQDVHLAVERTLTEELGELGKRVHTARSRNDQVAVDLRLYGKVEMLGLCAETIGLARTLLAFAGKHQAVPMAGRTHMRPAMPSSVGVWASAFTEGLLDDLCMLRAAYEVNDQCPLGSAAGYGVPLPIDRRLTARLLGFRAPVHNVLHAANARGKCEAMILSSMGFIMGTLARYAEDLILFSAPEFAYFDLPAGFCTGSSIMPQKQNPDVLELVRAKAVRILGLASTCATLVTRLPSGYHRDLQETKELLMEGFLIARSSVRILDRLTRGLSVNRKALLAGFTPAVFATDRALELVAAGMPFRNAYQRVREDLDHLQNTDPVQAIRKKTHLGAAAGMDWGGVRRRVSGVQSWQRTEQRKFDRAVARLLGAHSGV